MKKKILFLTGTRADYGKIKPLLRAVCLNENFELDVFVTGMHLSSTHGDTYNEVLNDHWDHVQIDHSFMTSPQSMSQALGQIILSFTGYLTLSKPDMVVVHGDRIEAFAGASAAAVSNIRVAHIEGGEVSGTIDESLRHAISKLSHEHFVCNDEAKNRLLKLGERSDRVYVMGSPDIDLMLSDSLPSIDEAKKHYGIDFENYAIAMLHPVTTRLSQLQKNVEVFVSSLIKSGRNYIVVYPNNDAGHETILSAYSKLEGNPKFKLFPSLRFELFLALLKNADFIIGNSSAGVREAGIYQTPAIDVGERQSGRYCLNEMPHLQHSSFDEEELLMSIGRTPDYIHLDNGKWGDGKASERFVSIIENEEFWNKPIEKKLPF